MAGRRSDRPLPAVQMNAVYSECFPILEPGPGVVLVVEGVTDEGKPTEVRINLPASGVQSLRRDLRNALVALPLELRQENNL